MFANFLGDLGGNLSSAVSESANKLIQAKVDKEVARHTKHPETTVQNAIPGTENKQLVKGVNSDGRTMVAGEVGNNGVTNPVPFYKTKPFVYGAGGLSALFVTAIVYRVATN